MFNIKNWKEFFNKKSSKKNILFPNIISLKQFFFEYKWILIFFVPFLFFQCYQILQQNWDTIVYSLIGKWFCGEQIYLELIRPLLPSFLNCFFGASEFSMLLTTIFACFVFLIGVLLVYERVIKESVDQLVFALFVFVAPWFLFYSNFGSDLLALAFLLVSFGVISVNKKGFFFALACLSRYTFLAFIIFFIFDLRKKPRDIIKFLTIFLLTWIPWFLFNYFYTGDIFFSVFESFYLNVVAKPSTEPFLLVHIIFIIFFVITFFLSNHKNIRLIFVQAAFLSIIMFVFSQIKETRFFGIAFFSTAFFAGVIAKKYFFAKIILILFLISLFLVVPFYYVGDELPIPQDEFIMDCRVASDFWPYFYSKGIVAEVVYDIVDLNNFILEGGSLVLYSDFKNVVFVGERIERDSYVIITSDSCSVQPKKYISGILRHRVFSWFEKNDINAIEYGFVDKLKTN